MACELLPYQKEWALKVEEMPEGCRDCRHRDNLYWLMGVPFCNHSGYTRAKAITRCSEWLSEEGQELWLEI